MSEFVKIVECPRDAWQGLPRMIPAAQKANYLRDLILAGFEQIDAVSFVSPTAVPQMADSEAVLKLLGPQTDAELIGIVVNEKGAERALKTRAVGVLGFPFSISSEFLRRNQNQTPDESMRILKSVVDRAHDVGVNVVVYVSMAFGNPYGDLWSAAEVVGACNRLIDLDVRVISLADTVGLASPAQVSELVMNTRELIGEGDQEVEVGVHLHARSRDAAEKIRAAYQAGCRRFDAAIGGLGGCPFAQDELVGNIPTEILISELKQLGAQMRRLRPLDGLMRANAEISASYGAVETIATACNRAGAAL